MLMWYTLQHLSSTDRPAITARDMLRTDTTRASIHKQQRSPAPQQSQSRHHMRPRQLLSPPLRNAIVTPLYTLLPGYPPLTCATHASAHAYQARAERTTCCIWNAQRPYQLRNTDASSLTFRETHSTLCQIGLLVGTI